jgi:MFS transporter, SHS family, lactate transporter
VGSALTMESIPPKSRGLVSGILQAGYPSGYLLASIVFGQFYTHIGWRGMFFVGVIPALLVLYVRSHVPESPAWKIMEKRERPSLLATLAKNWKLSVFSIVLMTCFNFFSHGSQDLYPTFLREQHHFDPHTVAFITIVLNVGAIVGGLTFGRISEIIGRRRAIFVAALLALPFLYLWAFSTTVAMLALGAFLMQISVQGAWGVIPVYLNEISPDEVRATFPGLVYQLGNLLASVNAVWQAKIAVANGGNYSMALVIVAGTVGVVIAAIILFGPERRGIDMTQSARTVTEGRGSPA